MFFEEVLVGLCQYLSYPKSVVIRNSLCVFGINFHCLILGHGYLQGHVKNYGTLMMLQFKTICNVCVAVCLHMYSV